MRTFGDFELLGFHLDYYQDGKFLGSEKLEDADRDTFGYLSRKYQVAEKDLVFKKNTIRKGTSYYTELIPLCGRVIGNIFEVRKANLKITE